MGKPHRLPMWSYKGRPSVFITCSTHQRHKAFEDGAVCSFLLADLFAKCHKTIEVTAYCVMPDHGHLLLTARHPGSDIPTAVRRWKQATGHWYSAVHRRKLWQGNYWDYILRDPDDARTVARYIVSDPVRSKLVPSLACYRWWGSECWTREELLADATSAEQATWWREQ